MKKESLSRTRHLMHFLFSIYEDNTPGPKKEFSCRKGSWQDLQLFIAVNLVLLFMGGFIKVIIWGQNSYAILSAVFNFHASKVSLLYRELLWTPLMVQLERMDFRTSGRTSMGQEFSV